MQNQCKVVNFQGFPRSFKLPSDVADGQLYKQAGNTITVNVMMEIFKKIYEVNVFGLAEITRLVIPFMHNYGHVVNISSMGGIQGSLKFSGLSAYSSSKGAVSILTEMLAEEYKETGPSFNCLAIGAVQTEMLENAFPGYKAKVSAKKFANYLLDFLLNGSKFYNGKVLQVSLSTP